MGSELGAPSADSSLTFGKREFYPHPATGEILLSRTLLRTAAVDPEGYARKELVYEMGVFQEQKFTVQVGAGIVADSIPELEYEEILNKAAQSIQALEAGARGES